LEIRDPEKAFPDPGVKKAPGPGSATLLPVPGARYNESDAQGAGNGQERADEEELDEFIISLRTQLEIFLNRSESRISFFLPIRE
jgi:hypothetical protein